MAGVFAQALLGGLVVVLHVTPIAVAGHYLLSAVLVANAVVLHHKAGRAGRAAASARPPRSCCTDPVALVGLAGLVLVTGTLVTGSGPHSGDDAADRLPFAVVTVARVHSLTVWVFLVAVLVVLRQVSEGDADARAGRPGPRARRRSSSPRARWATCSTPPACRRLLVAAHVLGLGARVGGRAAVPPRPHRAHRPPASPLRPPTAAGVAAAQPS